MYALVAPMLVFGAGAAIDYGRAQQVQTKLNAAADAAALVAITPAMLQQSPAVAEAAAASMFKGLADSSGVSPGATKVRVTVSPSSSVLGRNVQVDYATSVDTIFAQVIGMEQFPLSGHSQADTPTPPNIDPQSKPSSPWAARFMNGRAACSRAASSLSGCVQLSRRSAPTQVF